MDRLDAQKTQIQADAAFFTRKYESYTKFNEAVSARKEGLDYYKKYGNALQFAQGGKIHIDPSKTSHWHQVGGDLYSIRQLQSYTNKGRAGQTLPYTPNDPTFKYWDAKGVNGYDAGYWAFANNIANYAKDSKLRRSLEAYYKDRGFNAELTNDIIRTQATNGKAGGFHDIMAQAYADSLIPKVETPVTVATPTPTVQAAPSETIIDNTPLGTVKDNWMRAAPIIGNGIGAIAAFATPAIS